MKVDYNQGNLWGVDFGGTKIEGVILKSVVEPEVIFRHRVPTGSSNGYQFILQQFKELVDAMIGVAGYKPSIIGVGSPGTYVPHQKIMKNCNATVVNGNPLKEDLEELLGMEVKLANDANCFALAETKLGVVKSLYPKAKVVFGVILGTGVGGGLVVRGELLNGHHGIGGEWGHNILYPGEGPTCYCGKTGCNEQIISGPALERYYTSLTGEQKSLREIKSLFDAGADKAAEKTMKRLTEGFGKALSVVVNIVDPDVIVIGGGVSNIENVYTDSFDTLNEMMFNHGFEAPIIKAKLGDSAGVYGAALLCAKEKSYYEQS
ncbi:ROK family protein [Echinicola jeungdonensis]|uniref:ROK family protein n=1 Tax=Echinicola jeungdonensis TaxID=709343 RepID=A0ABV5J9D8_9BACT|nr:ROK family protein [Echinicola jeungdonensis]MDN3670469.1 ROK family protein [Echinicola jeungdonensis]